MQVEYINFLDELGYSLSCYARPMATLIESVKKDLMFSVILFKDLDSEFLGYNLKNFLYKELEIKFEDIFIYNKDIAQTLKNYLINDEKVMIYSDHYYNRNYEKYYGKIHYAHPVILCTCDEHNNKFDIIDEDIQKLSYVDKFKCWPHKHYILTDLDLVSLCGNWNKKLLLKHAPVENLRLEDSTDKVAFCQKCIVGNKVEKYNINWVVEKYFSYIKKILLREKEFKTYFIDRICDVYEQKECNEKSMNNIYNHIKSVNLQGRFFVLLLYSMTDNDNFFYKFEELTIKIRREYSAFYSMLLRFNVRNDDKCISEIIKYFIKSFSDEIELYNYIIRILDYKEIDGSFKNIKNIFNMSSIKN